MKNVFVSLFVMLLAVSSAHAVIIGSESFDYPDDAVAGKNEGYGWSWVSATQSQDGNPSAWQNLAGGTANIVDGKLELYGGSGWNAVRRIFSKTDEWGNSFQNAGIVYFAADVTIDEWQNWLGLSAQDGEWDERIKFGIPYQPNVAVSYFGINNEVTGTPVYSDIPVVVGQTYRLVGVVDFENNQARMWVDPDTGDYDLSPEITSADVVLDPLNMTNWISGVRLGNDVKATWDDVVTATDFIDTFIPEDIMGKAHNPNPAVAQEDVEVDNLVLSWDIARDPSDTANAAPDLVSHKLYIIDPTVSPDPNIVIADVSGWDGNLRASYTLTQNLNMDKTYYWRVDQVMTGGTIVAGDQWMFLAEKSTPEITGDPVFQILPADETASFSVTVSSLTPETYKWYKDGSPLSDGGNISGSETATLTITTVSENDEGLYLCKVNNDSGVEVESASAPLAIQALIAYWSFTDGDPNNDITEAPATKIYGDPVAAAGIVGEGFAFDSDAGAEDLIYTDPTDITYFNICNYQMTVSCWIKANIYASWGPMVARHGEGSEGWQLRNNGDNGNKICFTTRGTGNDDGSASSKTVYDGEWHYVVGTFDGSVKKVFIDGVLNVSNTATGPVNSTLSPVSLAGRVTGSGSELSFESVTACTLDEVKIYNYPRDEFAIAQEYANISGVSICPVNPAYDFNNDCKVDLLDFSSFAGQWLLDNMVHPQ